MAEINSRKRLKTSHMKPQLGRPVRLLWIQEVFIINTRKMRLVFMFGNKQLDQLTV